MSGPICFSLIPSKSAPWLNKGLMFVLWAAEDFVCALFEQRLEFMWKAKKVFGLVVFWGLDFSSFLLPKTLNTEDQTGFVFRVVLRLLEEPERWSDFFYFFSLFLFWQWRLPRGSLSTLGGFDGCMRVDFKLSLFLQVEAKTFKWGVNLWGLAAVMGRT